MTERWLTSVEICAGGGGQALGLEQAGFAHQAVVEIDKDACATLRHNRPTWKVVEGPIENFYGRPYEGVDLLAGGVPCFVAGTMILTHRGYMPIEEVTTTDRVLTHAGVWRKVTRTMITDNAPLWEVQAGQIITTTAEHPFFVKLQDRLWDNEARSYKRILSAPHWRDAKDLTNRHRIGHILPPMDPPSVTDEAWWWLAGRYLADGWTMRRAKTGAGNPVSGDQGRVVIACGPGKEDELRKHLGMADLQASEVRERKVIKFHVHGQRFYSWCKRFGQGAANKSLTFEALSLPADLADCLLSGYLAGDGHLAGNEWQATTTSKALALGMVLIAHRARGAAASIRAEKRNDTHVIEGRTVNQRPTWRISMPFSSKSHIIEDDYAWRLVRRSAPTGTTGRVYNIAVDEHESYIADGVIVHNCPPWSVASKQLGPEDERNLFPEALRLVEEIMPGAVLLENVKGLAEGRFAYYRDWIMATLRDLGYLPEWKVLLASAYGVPQLRPRFVLVALHESVEREFVWPVPTCQRAPSVGETLHDMMAADGWPGAASWAARASRIAPTIVGGSRKHGGPDLGPTRARAQWKELGVEGISIANAPPPSDFPLYGTPRLTIPMVARLQGFPDAWEFVGTKTARYRQVGNAFCPPVAKALGEAIARALR